MSTSQIIAGQLRPFEDDGFGPIVQVGSERRTEAVERLVSPGVHVDRAHARRFLEYAENHQVNLRGFWARLDRRGRVTASVLAVPSPGRTAMMFASRPNNAEHVRPVAGLIDHACRHLEPSDVNLAQVLLDTGQSLEREAFKVSGFLDLAVLSYLERAIRTGVSVRPPLWPSNAKLKPYTETLHATLLSVLDQSYEDTLDCPGLRGFRRTEDILEGHRASGIFDPRLWTILLLDEEPAGAVLMNPSADMHAVELVYLGLTKSARGRGLGAQLLRHGLLQIQDRREQMIHLAVDEANSPAISLYIGEGFRPALRRLALIRPLGASEIDNMSQPL